MKPKRCKACRQLFTPTRPLQAVCSVLCAHQSAINSREKLQRKETKAKLEKLKTRSQWLKEVQSLVNKYVRLRDAFDGCISCNKPSTWSGQWHASHYKSTGANSALRFNLWNIHKSCSVCNNHKSGNISEYRPRLLQKIGKKKLEFLESHTRTRIYSVDELKKFKKTFLKMCKRMEAKNANKRPVM